MPRVLITGSADGLGLAAARELVDAGHEVTLHARNDGRAADARAALPGASDVVVGDLSTVAGTRAVAERANAVGRFDVVVLNAAVGSHEPARVETADGLAHVFAINVLAPYLLTALLTRPDRLVLLSSGMHAGGKADLSDLQWTARPWNGPQAYSDSKLFDVVLAFAAARRWPDLIANAVDPGWIPTKMGGPNATGRLDDGVATQVWLATSDDPAAAVSGHYFFGLQQRDANPAASDPAVQDALLSECARLTGTSWPD